MAKTGRRTDGRNPFDGPPITYPMRGPDDPVHARDLVDEGHGETERVDRRRPLRFWHVGWVLKRIGVVHILDAAREWHVVAGNNGQRKTQTTSIQKRTRYSLTVTIRRQRVNTSRPVAQNRLTVYGRRTPCRLAVNSGGGGGSFPYCCPYIYTYV